MAGFKCSQCQTIYASNTALETDSVGAGPTVDVQGDCSVCGAGWAAIYPN